MKRRVVILGAAGRDFHDFNLRFRGQPTFEVVAFTATQIPGIDHRTYPAELAGVGYPNGIPIVPEEELEHVISDRDVDLVVFSYSDVPAAHVLALAARAQAAGADFVVPNAASGMLQARVPVIAVCAVRTGCGKSQTSRYVADLLEARGHRVVVIRHPMPYGDLARQAVQRFESLDDLELHQTTIEEREEYEPHLMAGRVLYAGVDYGAILKQAQREADIIIWDGGNNDLPFFVPDLHIVVLDPLRPNDVAGYYPSEVNVRMADVFLVNKVDSATPEQIADVQSNAAALNPNAPFVLAASPPLADHPDHIEGRRVLVIEDGPTLTHGGMSYGAGLVAARAHGAAEIIDPRPYAVGSIAETFEKYPGTGLVLPAMGYGEAQVADLEETIRRTPADSIVVATPIDLGRILKVSQPVVRIRYDLEERGPNRLADFLEAFESDLSNA